MRRMREKKRHPPRVTTVNPGDTPAQHGPNQGRNKINIYNIHTLQSTTCNIWIVTCNRRNHIEQMEMTKAYQINGHTKGVITEYPRLVID